MKISLSKILIPLFLASCTLGVSAEEIWPISSPQRAIISKTAVLQSAKEDFAREKQAIANRVKSGEISRVEAKQQIEQSRKATVEAVKTKLRSEREKLRLENRARVKALIRNKLNKIMTKIESLPESEKKAKYEKLSRAIEAKIASGKLSKKDTILATMVNEILSESK